MATVLTSFASLPASLAAAPAVTPEFRTVALSGNGAPGAARGVVFDRFSTPALNAAGQTAFEAGLSGRSVDNSNNSGIYSEGSGALAQVARTSGQALNAAPGVTFDSFLSFFDSSSSPVLNSAGQTAFFSFLNGPGVDSTNDGALYSEGYGTLAEVARTGDQTPDAAPGVVFDFVGGRQILNAAGQTAFFGNLRGPGVDTSNSQGIYTEANGALVEVARAGDQAPDAASGAEFRAFAAEPVLNAAGQTAFLSFLAGPGVDSTNDEAIYSEGTGALAVVARAGDHAPGGATGVVFDTFGVPVINRMGQVAFVGSLKGPGVDGGNNSGVYSEGTGILDEVAREGEQVPNAPPGLVFRNFSEPVLNAAGQTAFFGFLSGPGVEAGTGLYSEGNGVLTEVVRAGNQAPGAAPGVVFDDFVTSPALNAAGQTAFFGFLTGPGVDSSNEIGIYATDRDGSLVKIVRTGDLFDANDDPLIEDLRRISRLSFFVGSGNEDGRRSSFNDIGQLAFRASFTNGSSGVFVSNLVAVPEPTGCALLIAAIGAVATLRRRASS